MYPSQQRAVYGLGVDVEVEQAAELARPTERGGGDVHLPAPHPSETLRLGERRLDAFVRDRMANAAHEQFAVGCALVQIEVRAGLEHGNTEVVVVEVGEHDEHEQR